ncbi:MAG TPA: NAD(P)-dependent oxidoreductase [Acidimicrobiales bacterium]|nr:NAD(P)-dependent oxidoreductase [Acidimicrobiales bacterium]
MKILAVGDSYMPSRFYRRAFAGLEARHDVAYLDLDPSRRFDARTESERTLREHQGDPAELVAEMAGVEVLAVQGAPVTEEVLDASGSLRLVACARGGPVNVDTRAATARGIPVVTTPGKNAEAVADLTIAFVVLLARRLLAGARHVVDEGELPDNWVGASFMGRDLRGLVLGLVGFGQVGQRVARRAAAFSMRVLAYDPYVLPERMPELVEPVAFEELLARSDVVSLHARSTPDNIGLFGAAVLASMRPGAFLVNTARETLVDEAALDEALASGHLGGAALDVVNIGPPGPPPRLLRHPNVVVTPHLGGATEETLLQGGEMIAAEIERFERHEPLRHVANPEVTAQ